MELFFIVVMVGVMAAVITGAVYHSRMEKMKDQHEAELHRIRGNH